ncbi:MAG: gamma-butyrobetaine hydroxylase-like domain-containing protein [Candidatus Methylomirabilia bacterium]
MTKLTLPIFGQPDPNAPSELHLVGRYALGVTWADRHSSIYPFQGMRRECPCGACATISALTQEMSWPKEIRRIPEGLRVVWLDGHESCYPYPELRALCRCAACAEAHK